mgnify:CR=1 FL=1
MCRLITRAAQDRPDRHLRREAAPSAAHQAAAADLAVRQVVPAVHLARQVSAAVAVADSAVRQAVPAVHSARQVSAAAAVVDSAAHQAVPAVLSAAEDPVEALSTDNIEISGFKTV